MGIDRILLISIPLSVLPIGPNLCGKSRPSQTFCVKHMALLIFTAVLQRLMILLFPGVLEITETLVVVYSVSFSVKLNHLSTVTSLSSLLSFLLNASDVKATSLICKA